MGITGKITPESFPRIKVFLRGNVLFSLDNRRLWLFKQLGKSVVVDIVYSLDFNVKFTSTTGLR